MFEARGMDFAVYSKGKKVDGNVFPGCLHADSKGVFESLRTYNGIIFREEEHLHRLAESARTCGYEVPPLRELRKELKSALKAYGKEKPGNKNDVFLRISLWGGKVFVLAGSRKHASRIYQEGIALRTTAIRRSLTHAAAPQTKTHAYQNAVLALLQPSPGVYERLFLDQDGLVSEVSIGNIFIVKKKSIMGKGVELLTPPASGVLNGVTRRFVIECASLVRIPCEERPLSRHDVYNAGEVFLTNTSWEILPVREVDGRLTGRPLPGTITQKIHQLFKRRALQECRRERYAAL